MVLDRFLGDIAPRTISLALADRYRAIFERRQILVDLLDLILDFAGVGFEIGRHGDPKSLRISLRPKSSESISI